VGAPLEHLIAGRGRRLMRGEGGEGGGDGSVVEADAGALSDLRLLPLSTRIMSASLICTERFEGDFRYGGVNIGLGLGLGLGLGRLSGLCASSEAGLSAW